jgi:hypothetical protein
MIGEPLELLFKTRTEGAAEVDKLAASAQRLSGATAQASTGITSLGQATDVLTRAVTANAAALGSQAPALDAAAAGTVKLAGGARMATTELKMLEGAMPIRAAGAFLSKMEAFGPIIQAAYPIAGAIALVGVLGVILGKMAEWANAHNAVLSAQETSISLLEKEGKEYDKLAEKVRKLRLDEIEYRQGKDVRLRVEAGAAETEARYAAQRVAELEKLQATLGRLSQVSTRYAPVPRTFGMAGEAAEGVTQPVAVTATLTEEDTHVSARLRALLGLPDKQKTGLEGLFGRAGQPVTEREARAAANLSIGLDEALAHARMEQTQHQTSKSTLDAKADSDERKKAAEEAKKHQQELDSAEKQAAAYLRQALTFELTGLAKINEVYREKLELLGKTKKAVEDINAAHAIEVNREFQHIFKENRKYLAGVAEGNEKADDRMERYDVKQFQAALKKQIEEDGKHIASGVKVLQASDDADADAVRHGLGVTLKSNALAERGGRMSGSAAAGADYAARLAAADRIFDIETQGLDLIVDKDKADEKLAQARKKRAEEIYRAEEQYENQIQTLREKDLEKYQGMAGSLFDALRGHSTGQWIKDLAIGQVRQVFTNAVTPALQGVGHALGGLIPGQSGTALGGLLHGTLFDSKNKGVADASVTAKQTTRTADEVHALRADVRAMSGAPAPSGAADGGAGLGAILPGLGGNPLSIFGSDIGGWTGGGLASTIPGLAAGGASALFKAGSGSGLTQLLSGMTGMGSNPLAAIFSGQSTNGNTVTELTSAQRVGAALGTATALAGAGMGIYSGLREGGVGGYSKAAASGLGAAAMLDPEPVSKMILGTVAAMAGIFGMAFGSNRERRALDISETLSANRYLAPTALNVIQGMNGTYEDFDARGNLRTSTMSAVPTVLEPYITSRVMNGQRNYYDVPGQVTAPYSGGSGGRGQAPIAGAGSMVVHIHAVDAQSFMEFAQRNHAALGEAVATHLESHDGRLTNGIRFIAGNS